MRVRWGIVVAFAIAMAWVESASVLYIRALVDRIEPYQANPLPINGALGNVELWREAATLVMLAAVGMLAGRTWRHRAGYAAVAFGIWIKRRDIAAAWARSLAPIHKLLLNKYYVDEIYDATVVRPVQAVSREGLWRGVDVGVIDGAVNGVATIVDAGSMVLRRLQTGSVRAYAGSLFIGVVLMLGYYLWR